MARRVPVQKRSRERVDTILAATGKLIADEGADRVSMRRLAEVSGVPVASIYQYFENREEVIAAFLESEMEQLDLATAEAMLKLERIDLRKLLETIGHVHLEYHRNNPAAVNVWFSGRAGYLVADRIRAQNARLGEWLRGGVVRSGLLSADAPQFGAALTIRQFDRMFEFVFLEQRSDEEQEEILAMHVDFAALYLERFAGPNNGRGVTVEDFLAALGEPPAYVVDVD
ncbi:MAG: TetR/AcrR family transcriptional regulator [Solirubrobacterales bacterium]